MINETTGMDRAARRLLGGPGKLVIDAMQRERRVALLEQSDDFAQQLQAQGLINLVVGYRAQLAQDVTLSFAPAQRQLGERLLVRLFVDPAHLEQHAAQRLDQLG